MASRNDKDLTREFAGLAAGLGDPLGGQAAVLDGELVVLNEVGQPEFALMQERRGRYQQSHHLRLATLRRIAANARQRSATALHPARMSGLVDLETRATS